MSSKWIYRLSAIMLALFIGVAGVSALGYANASQPVATPTALAVIQPTLVPAATLVPAPSALAESSKKLETEPFIRSELFFGSERGDEPEVSDAEFKQFLDESVTPRFPDGLTVLKGFGQFREANNVIVQESSFVLILLYPNETRRDSSNKIEAIRAEYLSLFGQESVLRVDDPRPVRVAF
ncbi:MAG: DUF3574 domain-containing protein [Chloroflexales bacterium]|nr:DUF3574 domain-containing protein [Chloroflexales bacterium]